MRHKFVPGVLLDGRFRTVCPLNHGSFGLVFKCQDIVTGRDVALKYLYKETPENRSLLDAHPGIKVDERSEELDIHRHVGSHPTVVNLLHHFETDNHTYLVLEYCQNGDL